MFTPEARQGRVIDRRDPDGLGRVRVESPGLFEAPSYSDWIYPFGLLDATEGRGMFVVPKIGTNVVIVFVNGASHYAPAARYIVGPWGAPKGVSDVPAEAEIGNPDIVVFGFDGFALVVDERSGQRKMTLLDRATQGSYFRLDLETGDVLINSKRDKSESIGRDLKITVVGDVDIQCQGEAQIKASASILIDGTNEIKLGQAAQEFLAKKSFLQAWALSHVHSGVTVGAGVSGGGTPIPDVAFTVKTKGE